MTRDEVILLVNESLSQGFEIPAPKLTPQAQLFTELGLDSLDAVDMVVQLEERFKVKLDGDKIREIRSLNDVHELVWALVQEGKK